MDPGNRSAQASAGKLTIKSSRISNKSSKLSAKLSPPNIFKTFTAGKDPVRENLLEGELQKIIEQMALAGLNVPKKKKEPVITPEMGTRVQLAKPPEPTFPRPPYEMPITKKQRWEKLERRLLAERDRNFCRWENIYVPKPVDAAAIGRVVDVPSPDVSFSKIKVFPRSPSFSASQGIPEVPSPSELELHKPKSGVFINVTDPPEMKDQRDSFDLVYERKPRPKRPGMEDEEVEIKTVKRKKRRKRSSQDESGEIAEDEASSAEKADGKKKKKRKSKGSLDDVSSTSKAGAIGKQEGDVQGGEELGAGWKEEDQLMSAILEEDGMFGEGEGEGEDLSREDTYLTKMFRRKVSQVSKATSLNSKELTEFPVYDEEDLEGEPFMTKIIQKFRRDSEAERYKPPPRKIKRGTLESHSFTKLKQPIVKDFYFGLMMGSLNQADEHFEESSRGLQGICMSVAAYCYAMIEHPDKWTEFTVDDVMDVGTQLYLDSLDNLHMHEERKELEFNELHKYCFVEDKKIQFQVFEPEIVGMVRSIDKKVYNLYKGLHLFFNRHRAGIFKSIGISVIIWKDKHFYIYDARGRGKDLLPDEINGKAMLANFYDVPDVATVLLNYSNLENWPFTISKISVYKIMDKEAIEEEADRALMPERSDYNILNENKAVIQGSFDLGDLCFDFTRNKQAIAMAAVCLVYSRITPPSAWHGKTIDKIMIIGNQLYLELVETEHVLEMELERLPAMFTVGPYMVEIMVYSNVYADVMYRKGTYVLQKDLEKFFEINTMAIVYIGKFVVAIWKQRNMYYYFDPYSRNHEALRCRNGTACVSMNSNIETMISTVVTNFDTKEDIFYIHALKVLKINRDPVQAELFPKTMTMDDFRPEHFKDYKMKKSKKKAVDKHVTADFTETAVKRLLPWDFLAPSIIDVGSTVASITEEQMPPMVHRFTSKAMLRSMLPEIEKAIDLDSPSLSDTQIEPDRPAPILGEEAINMDAWELTQEELEMQGGGEGEGEGEDAAEAYMAMNRFAQVHPDSLDSYHKKMSAQVNTDITVGFLPVPRDILPPTNMRWKQKLLKERELAKKRDTVQVPGDLAEPVITQSMELKKPSNYIDLPDNSQLIRGHINISTFGKETEFMAPFICMMASAVAQKYTLLSWATEIIDYTMRSGEKLYHLSRVRYDQVPILEVPKVSLGRSDYSILVQYLYDTLMKQQVLEVTLEKLLFKKYECGLVVTPSYACAVFLKNHLYYMFDPFGCNNVGLGEGPTNDGTACVARFKNIHDLASRIMFNKIKRDSVEEYEYSRFVVSSCTAKFIPPEPEKVAKKSKSKTRKHDNMGEEEGGSSRATSAPAEELEPENRVGYQFNDGILTLQGTTCLPRRAEMDFEELKEDHFVCICACLMLLNYPVLKWDTKKVDYVIEQGQHIYSHAENLKISKKRIIRNILIYQHFFDIIVTSVEITDWRKNKNLSVGIDTIMNKRNIILVQFPNCCYAIYKHNDFYHVFDPYSSLPNGAQDGSEKGPAGWTLFKGIEEVKKRIKEQILAKGEHYIFYSFEVTSVRKAPKKTLIAQRLQEYDLDIPIKPEEPGKPFHEKDYWLKKDPIPWSRMKTYTAKNLLRGKKENMWHNWDVEYPKDLFSLVGTVHQTAEIFEENVRGKQTLAILVVAIGMVEIYELSEWSVAIMDNVITNGNAYFKECIKTITDEDHELAFEDLKTDCTIYPYEFEIVLTPAVEGTMFLMRSNQFNLYKALKIFLDNFESRYGIICVTKGEEIEKRFLAFGKIRESEYFMYDCQAFGPPMFLDKKGTSIIFRCKSLKRLLHVMVMTLRGGDFYILEVDVDNFKAID